MTRWLGTDKDSFIAVIKKNQGHTQTFGQQLLGGTVGIIVLIGIIILIVIFKFSPGPATSQSGTVIGNSVCLSAC